AVDAEQLLDALGRLPAHALFHDAAELARGDGVAAVQQPALELVAHFFGGRVAVFLIRRQRLHDDGFQVRRKIWVELVRALVLAHQDLAHGLGPRSEGPQAERRHVQHAAESVDIDAAIGLLAGDLFGREITELALHLASPRALVQLIARLGHAEIAD